MIAANCSKWYFVAVNIREDNTDTMYFTETDHLGSIFGLLFLSRARNRMYNETYGSGKPVILFVHGC
jgi:hypothetical protein